MKHTFLAVAFLTALGTGAAIASEGCNVPKTEWQPRENLIKKLEADGWKIKRIKTEAGCCEAYAIDGKGNRVEASFDPKTFAVVKTKID